MSNTYVSMSNGFYQLNPGVYEGFQISEEKSLDKSEEEKELQQDINTSVLK